jgi:two-component system cell cycle sensor histidine kinase/response regulator CckA
MTRTEVAAPDMGDAITHVRPDVSDLVDEIDAVVWEADPETFAFTFVSKGAERLLGYPSSRWLNEPGFWVAQIHPDDQMAAVALCEAATAQALDHEFEYRMIAADGSVRWVRDLVRVGTDASGKANRLRGVIFDETKRIQADVSRRETEARLHRAGKLEAVGRLAGGIAHDFNNLLLVILSYTELLIESLQPEDPRLDDLIEIRSAATGGADLTRQLLAFSRQQMVHPVVVSLGNAVVGIERLLRRLVAESIQVITHIGDTPIPVLIDPGQLEQVIVNLALNARDAMPEGGTLTIEARIAGHEELAGGTPFTVMFGRYAMLRVTDTGVGMDEATQNQIFEPFFTTKASGKGSGLGLSTVHGIVRQNGGCVMVKSEPGKGSEFTLILPLINGMPGPEELHEELTDGVGRNETVLLVEDETAVRAVTRKVLEHCAFHVLEAPTGQAALDLAAVHRGEIHCLLTDLVMPGITGRELAHEVRILRPEIRVLYMSGHADETLSRHGGLEPGAAYIAKPFTPAALVRKVRGVIDAG